MLAAAVEPRLCLLVGATCFKTPQKDCITTPPSQIMHPSPRTHLWFIDEKHVSTPVYWNIQIFFYIWEWLQSLHLIRACSRVSLRALLTRTDMFLGRSNAQRGSAVGPNAHRNEHWQTPTKIRAESVLEARLFDCASLFCLCLSGFVSHWVLFY